MKTPPVGIPEIDAEHEKLHNIVTALQDALETVSSTPAEIGALLASLISETRHHFQSEEEHMGRHAYSFRQAHSEEHKHLLRALESVEKMHSSGEMPADRPVVQFIWDWLNDHVKSSDQQYAAFVRGRA